MEQLTKEFDKKLTVMPKHLSIRDRDRNLNLPLSFAARLGSNYRALSNSFINYHCFLKAQYLTFDNEFECNSSNQKRFISLKNWDKNLLNIHNYYMEYGNTSCYQMTHVQSLNNLIINNISISIAMDNATRKKTQIPINIKQLCDENINKKYPKEWLNKYYKCKKQLVFDINNLDEIKKDKLIYSNALSNVKLQLRFNDEDGNHHLNSGAYIRLIEEACNQWDIHIRKGKKMIYSMTVCYWKEINVEIFSDCLVSFLHCDGTYIYGTISVNGNCFRDITNSKDEISYCTGFVLKIVNFNDKAKL
eukprot:395531_1